MLTLGLQGITIRNSYVINGAAVTYFEDLAGQLINCIFENNISPSNGGAVSVIGGSIRIIDCRFVDNQASVGGGVSVQGAVTHLEGCTFQGNIAGMGGGLHMYSPFQGLVSECTFFGNRADQGSAISITSISVVAPFNVYGSIMAGSTFGEGLYWDGVNDLVLTSCDIFGNAGGDWVGPIADALYEKNNFQLDPLFCDAEAGDFTLAANSPCLPENSMGGVQVGAWGLGCGLSSVGDLPGRGPVVSCYPNPFNPRVSIRFTLDRAQPVRVEVFDLGGRQVAVLKEGLLAAGNQLATWAGQDADGAPVPSGSYLIRVGTEEGASFSKVLLLK